MPDTPPGPLHPENDPTLAPTLAGMAVPSASPAPLPTSIGAYRIIGRLGEGGMGTVYEAEQQNPRRVVALKVIKAGHFMDEGQVRLFRREVDVLARLKHPGIAAIYDAGITLAGEHYFAMELARGATLGEFLRTRPQVLDTAEIRFRLQLIREICEAVNYAHLRGVIHRDLKPSNIIVTLADEAGSTDTLPAIKVLDFGLARITESDVQLSAMTEVGVIKGTLAYMSPEQARGDSSEIDIRADVYSLGVILYEMLSGERPHSLSNSSLIEALRAISEEPPVPLRRAWHGAKRLDPDIETIVGKALESDANARYASAAALGEDVGRYLESRPILARPPSTVYLARKFVRRNRGLVWSTAATLLVLIAGIVASATFGIREARQRGEAERARRDTESVAEFQQQMLQDIDPARMGSALAADLRSRLEAGLKERGTSAAAISSTLDGYDADMRVINTTDAALRVLDQNILGRALATTDTRFGQQPLIRARLKRSIGSTYASLGLYDQAGPPLIAARALYDSVQGRESMDGADATNDLANMYTMQGDVEKAEPLLRSVLALRRRKLGPDDPATLMAMNDLALLCGDANKPAEAESLYARVLPAMQKLQGDEDRRTIATMANYGWLLTNEDRLAQAEPLAVKALALRRRVLGNEHPETMQSVNNVAVLYKRQGRLKDAEALYLEDYQVTRRLLGSQHPELLPTMANLGRLYTTEKKYAEAEKILGEASALAHKNMPRGYVGTGIILQSYGELLVELKRFGEAEPKLLEAYSILVPAMGKGSGGVVRCAKRLAELYAQTGRAAQAKIWSERATPAPQANPTPQATPAPQAKSAP